MPLFQVGPAPNAVGCTLNPTRLPPDRIHCLPVLRVGSEVFKTSGSPAVLKDLMDARFVAQRSGIQIDGEVRGKTIHVLAVNAPRRAARTGRPTGTVARAKLARRVEPTRSPDAVVLFEAEVEGILIELLATRPAGGV